MCRPRPHGAEPDRASSTSAACGRSSSTGSSRGRRAASACCGSRTPTRAARSPRRSSRSRSRCAGSGSTGTGRSRSSSTAWTAAASSRARLVDEGKAYEDEGAIRFRMPDEGVDWLGRRGARADRVPERGARGPRDRPLRRAADVQLRLAGRGHARRDHARDPRRRPRLEHAEADPHPARARRRVPVYAHVPNVFGADGKKLSKRHGAVVGRRVPRRTATCPPALMNFLALLGWSYDDKTTIMSRRRADRALLARPRRRERRRRSTTRSSTG